MNASRRPNGRASDELVEMLARHFDASRAAIVLVDGERLHLEARVGIDVDSSPAGPSLCGHVVTTGTPLVLEDASRDVRFADIPFLPGGPTARFFAGHPLVGSNGEVIGALVVMDDEPEDLSRTEQARDGFMASLAGLASHVIESREVTAAYEEELKRSSHDTNMPTLYLDERARVTWANADARRLLSVPRTIDHPIPLGELVALTQETLTAIIQAIATGSTMDEVDTLKLGDPTSNAPREVKLAVTPRRIPGQSPGARCSLTARNFASSPDELLQRYENLFDFVDLVCTADVRGHLDVLNPAWVSLFGWTKSELRSQPALSFVHPDDVEATKAAFARLRQEGSVARFENRHRCRDGTYKTLSWAASVVDGVIVAGARDVTSDVAAREQLRFSNQLHTLVESLQRQFIEQEGASDTWWNEALQGLIALTDSEYGFIGTIEQDEQGKYLHTKAITDISWDAATRELYARNRATGMIFRNLDTLFGRVITSGATVVANDVATDPRATGRPAGHPPLDRFLGIACGRGDGLVGMIALANRKQSYTPDLIANLEPAAAFVESTVKSIRDAARRKLAEKRLNAIIETSGDAIISIDLHGIILSVNSAVERMFGYAPAECIGQNVKMLMRSPEHEQHDGYLSRYLHTGKRHIIGQRRDVVGRRRDGSEIWLELAVTEIETEGVRSFTGVLKDVTDRVLDEQRLGATATQLAGALEMANAARWEYDVATDHFTLNNAFFKLFGTSLEHVGSYYMSSADYVTRFVHPDDGAKVASEIARLALTTIDAESRVLQHRSLYADGRIGHMFVRIFGAQGIGEMQRRYNGVVQDITIHRREEETLARIAEQERLNHALQERLDELDQSRRVSALTSECVELVQRCVSIDESLAFTCRFLAQMYPQENMEFYERIDETQDFTLRVREVRFGTIEPRDTIDASECWAIRTRRVYAVLPGSSRVRCAHLPKEIREGQNACVCAPLLSMDRMVGVVTLTLPLPEDESSSYADQVVRTVAQFETTVQSIGGALSTVTLRESLQRLALVDELTALPNRRAFVAAAQKSLSRARRGGDFAVVAIFDVDHFKQVNDTWGHDAGDRVLQQIGGIAAGFFRADDVVGRLGGEEFGVVMLMTDPDEAASRLNAFRLAVRERCRIGDRVISISVGYACAGPSPVPSLDDLTRSADNALYRAKRSGRDCVMREDPAAVPPARKSVGRLELPAPSPPVDGGNTVG